MKKRFSITTVIAVLTLGAAAAAAAELPTYDLAGLPITPHQMSALGLSAHIQEQPATPTIMLGGMPASPHQIAVLTRRPGNSEQAVAPQPIEAAASQFGPVTRSE